MIKTLAKQIKEYKSASLVTPIFMILEVAMEMVIPLLMASIIDDGVQAGRYETYFCHRLLHDPGSYCRIVRRCHGW